VALCVGVQASPGLHCTDGRFMMVTQQWHKIDVAVVFFDVVALAPRIEYLDSLPPHCFVSCCFCCCSSSMSWLWSWSWSSLLLLQLRRLLLLLLLIVNAVVVVVVVVVVRILILVLSLSVSLSCFSLSSLPSPTVTMSLCRRLPPLPRPYYHPDGGDTLARPEPLQIKPKTKGN
jgi:hypothetical protein